MDAKPFIQLDSEFGKLKKVLMHRPGNEIDRLKPDNLEELLFNDIPFLPIMAQEHDNYVKTIREISDARVYILNDLLTDILTNEHLAEQMFTEVLPDECKPMAGEILEKHSTAQTAYMLTSGLNVRMAKRKIHSRILDNYPKAAFLIPPKPNLYFTRDPAAFTQGGVILSQMHYPARQRETYLVEMILKNHPEFKDHCRFIEPGMALGPTATVEGGDVIILSNKALAIGNSERTNSQAIEHIAKELIGKGQVERVYEVMLPKKRHYMHLDTVFTMVDENLVVTFLDALQEIRSTPHLRSRRERKKKA